MQCIQPREVDISAVHHVERAGLEAQHVQHTLDVPSLGIFIPTPGQADADVAALKKASTELDRLLAARSVAIDAVAAEFKAIRKKNKTGGTGKRLARKSASSRPMPHTPKHESICHFCSKSAA